MARRVVGKIVRERAKFKTAFGVPDAREVRDKALTEAQWATTVEGLLDAYGWRWCHFRPARTERGWRTAISGKKGFPDYAAARDSLGYFGPARFILLELKSESGRMSPEQQEWHDMLKAAGAEVIVARPSDYERLVEVLK